MQRKEVSQEACKEVFFSRKKAPPNPTPPYIPSDDASSHHDEELDTSPSPTPVRSPSTSRTSRPSSPVSSIAGDGKGPGEGHVKVNKLKTPLFQLYFVSSIHCYVIFYCYWR